MIYYQNQTNTVRLTNCIHHVSLCLRARCGLCMRKFLIVDESFYLHSLTPRHRCLRATAYLHERNVTMQQTNKHFIINVFLLIVFSFKHLVLVAALQVLQGLCLLPLLRTSSVHLHVTDPGEASCKTSSGTITCEVTAVTECVCVCYPDLHTLKGLLGFSLRLVLKVFILIRFDGWARPSHVLRLPPSHINFLSLFTYS